MSTTKSKSRRRQAAVAVTATAADADKIRQILADLPGLVDAVDEGGGVAVIVEASSLAAARKRVARLRQPFRVFARAPRVHFASHVHVPAAG